MDLEKNIRIAFEVYWKNLPVTTELNTGTHSDAFIAGAKSQAAKDYWYNEFKRKCTPIILDEYSYLDTDTVIKILQGKKELELGDGILEQSKNVPVFDMSKHDPIYKDWIDCVLGLKEKQEEYQKYIDEHPDSPISFDDWGFKVKHCPDMTFKQINRDSSDCAMKVNGKQTYYPFGTVQSDPLYGAINKMFDNVKPKNIGIIGHGKSMVIVLDDSWDVARQALNKIESIVPIADIIPDASIMHLNSTHGVDLHEEQILPPAWNTKQELLKMHDKAIERSITEETYKESRAWDIKKEKKVSHKRTNKRR